MKEIAKQIQIVYEGAKADLMNVVELLEKLILEYTLLMVILMFLILILVVAVIKLLVTLQKAHNKHYLFKRELRNDIKLFYAPRKESNKFQKP